MGAAKGLALVIGAAPLDRAADGVSGPAVGFGIGVVMENLGDEVRQQHVGLVLGVVAADLGVIGGQGLGEIDGAGARGAAGRLVIGIEGVDEILAFIGPEEDRALAVLRLQAVARQDGALPHELEKLLGDDAVFVPGQRGHIHDDDRAVKGHFRDKGGLRAKGVMQAPPVEAVERGR